MSEIPSIVEGKILLKGDFYLLIGSDGLIDYIDANDIAKAAEKYNKPEELVRHLCEQAYQSAPKDTKVDNISVVLLHVCGKTNSKKAVFAGVFDGHGPDGHGPSTYAKQRLQKIIVELAKKPASQMMHQSSLSDKSELDSSSNGSSSFWQPDGSKSTSEREQTFLNFTKQTETKLKEEEEEEEEPITLQQKKLKPANNTNNNRTEENAMEITLVNNTNLPLKPG